MRFISADRIFDGSEFLPDNSVLVLDHKGVLLNCVKREEVGENKPAQFDGIICPGFVNAHCHLELSHMLGTIPKKTGLVNFAKGIIAKRKAEEELVNQAIQKADAFMYENGVVAVGDICNGPKTFPAKAESKIHYHSFIELIGLNPAFAEGIFSKGKEIANAANEYGISYSLAPHAPYSVSQELMKLIGEFNSECYSVSTIHNQESEEENKFFKGLPSDFNELYSFLNLDISYFTPSGKSSLQTYLPSLVRNDNFLLVHNTFSNKNDIDFAASLHNGLYWCLCPNANLYIENKLPDVNLLIEKNVNVCLGTDSLASNHSLSIVDEINVLLDNFPDISHELLLKWATSGGAKALGVEGNYGSLIPKRKPGLNLIDISRGRFRFLQKLA